MESPNLKVFLAGDVMTGRGIDQILPHPGDPQLWEGWVKSAKEYVALAERMSGPIPRQVDPAYIWGDALELLAAVQPDVRIINLETAVTADGGPWPNKGIHYRMHPDNIGCLTVARIDCHVLANNHILDFSFQGLADTLTTLDQAELSHTGAGEDAEAAWAPARLEAEGGRRVVVIGLGTTSSGIPPTWAAGPDRPGVALLPDLSTGEVDRVASVVAAAGRSDLVVASIHWGPNWGYDVPASHRRFARALIGRAGVHVVHGHSSHHPMGIEVYRHGLILYGCGDLINDYEGIGGHEQYRSDLHLLYLPTFHRGALVNLELIPVKSHRFRLVRTTPEETGWLAATLSWAGGTLRTRVTVTESGSLGVEW